jgi:alpha-1,2-mannosyltransferase
VGVQGNAGGLGPPVTGQPETAPATGLASPPSGIPPDGRRARPDGPLSRGLLRISTAALACAYVVSAAVCCVLAATGQARFTDLHVYRMGGEAALHGASLYQLSYAGLPFTYPPLAAALFAVVAVLPWALAATLLTVATAIIFPALFYLALRLPPVSSWLDRGDAWRLALAAATAGIWLEPVRTTLGYGQVDVLLAAAVLYDLSLPDGARRKGIAIGLAAGFKLTPAIFVPYLLLTRRYRAAATAAAAFAATVALGYAVLPAPSSYFWNAAFLNPGRISKIDNDENQSLLGGISRTLHSTMVFWPWLLVAAVVAVVGLGLAARAQRRGDEGLGFSLCAITGLLISPMSWTHHWVLAVPALLLAALALYRNRAASPLAWRLGGGALAVLAIVGWARVARQIPASGWLHLSVRGLLDSEVYVLAGLIALALAAWSALAQHRHGRAAK